MLRWLLPVAMVLAVVDLHAQHVPVLEKITATASSSYDATIRGAAGAVPSSSLVAVMNLHNGHYTIVKADASGAFEASVFAPGGSSVLVKADPSGDRLRDAMEGKVVLAGEMLSLEGTVIQVPDPAEASGATTMNGLSLFWRLPAWVAQAKIDKRAYGRDEPMTIEGSITIFGSAAPGETPQLNVGVSLAGLSRADGRGTLDQNTFCSVVTTPTGLPIERTTLNYAGMLAFSGVSLQAAGDRLQATFRVTTSALPAEVADGYYRPVVFFAMSGIALSEARRVGIADRTDDVNRRRNGGTYGLLPVIRVGNPAPPRLLWTLLPDTFSQGARGVTAVEDRDRFAVASRIAVSSDRFVVPRRDARTGVPIRYDLEPAALTVAIGNKGFPINWPTIPLRFPSGSLTVSIRRPSGVTTTIGPAPFRQPRLVGVTGPRGLLDANYFTDPFRLTTLDPRFTVEFVEDGAHEIAVAGTIEDIWGNVWTGGGTYVIDVARPLEIDSALLPGTPLEVGDAINPSVQLVPPVAGDVEVRFRFAANSRRDQLTEQTFRVKANAHGFARFEPIAITTPGEYRIDVNASYRDSRNQVWSGTRTWGNVVKGPVSLVELHGARGVDDQPSTRLPWYSRKQIGWSKDSGGHVQFPFLSGDVMWMADDDATTPAQRIDDRNRLVTPVMLEYCCNAGLTEDQVTAGEAPFYSVGPNGVDPHMATTTDNELWAYSYRFVERPRVRIREMISEESVGSSYWRFDDRYAMQSGTGANGDRPNDIKFQFGGLALYGRRVSQPIYSTYASLFVLIANDDPLGTRVFPPFEGNGGGPDGGPLFQLKGRDIEMFFHPTAVRPGTILDRGQIASFAGQIGPPLGTNVEIVVTSPGGVVRTIRGRSNSIGYFYQPASDFVVDEPGVWRARVKVSFEGRTSAGQVTQPYPTGDVLGSRDGEFSFYVVDLGALLALSPLPRFAAGGAMTLTVSPPPGLTDLELHHTTTMPGFVLEDGALTELAYRFDPARFANDFPNLDAGVETIVISLLLSGRNATGVRQYVARQILLQGDEVLMPDAPPVRRRGVKR